MVFLTEEQTEQLAPWIGRVVLYFAELEGALDDLGKAIDGAMRAANPNPVFRLRPGQIG